MLKEDFLIEEILQRAFLDDELEPQKSKLEFDFQEIAVKKKGEIDVEVYKKLLAKQLKRYKRKQKRKKLQI